MNTVDDSDHTVCTCIAGCTCTRTVAPLAGACSVSGAAKQHRKPVPLHTHSGGCCLTGRIRLASGRCPGSAYRHPTLCPYNTTVPRGRCHAAGSSTWALLGCYMAIHRLAHASWCQWTRLSCRGSMHTLSPRLHLVHCRFTAAHCSTVSVLPRALVAAAFVQFQHARLDSARPLICPRLRIPGSSVQHSLSAARALVAKACVSACARLDSRACIALSTADSLQLNAASRSQCCLWRYTWLKRSLFQHAHG
jgi:hypothetical protein